MKKMSLIVWLACFSLVSFLSPEMSQAAVGKPVIAPVSGIFNTEAHSAFRSGMRVYESERGRQLLGEIIEADLPRLLPGWNKEFTAYAPNPSDIVALAEFSQQVEIICVLGTWCSDSEREVPRFWKVLQEAHNPNFELTMFAVGRSADSEALKIMQDIGFDDSLRQVYDVELVPTFIFSIAGSEIGRIIETPDGTLEGEMTRILLENTAGGNAPAWH